MCTRILVEQGLWVGGVHRDIGMRAIPSFECSMVSIIVTEAATQWVLTAGREWLGCKRGTKTVFIRDVIDGFACLDQRVCRLDWRQGPRDNFVLLRWQV